MRIQALVFLLTGTVALHAQQATAPTPGPSPAVIPQPHLALTNANIVDVRQGRLIPNGTVVIRDGKIVSVGAGAAPAGAEVLDVRGKFLAPGLMDAKRALEAGSSGLIRDEGRTARRLQRSATSSQRPLRGLVRSAKRAGSRELGAGSREPTWEVRIANCE